MGQTENKYQGYEPNLTISITTLNENGPNSPNKKQRVSDQIKKVGCKV